MKSFTSFFNLHKETKHAVPEAKPDTYEFSDAASDPKSLEAFRRADLSRGRFTYAQLAGINWWPDEILRLLEILFVTYNEFINLYRSDTGTFDNAIRNAIYFMNQKKYNKTSNISKFVNYGDFKVADGYLAVVIAEDNCHMRESDDRKRSSNEYKHHLLVKALETLLTLSPIKDGELSLKPEYERLLHLFLTIYNLKNLYAVTDDTLRTVLLASLDNTSLDIDLNDYFTTITKDLSQLVLSHLSQYHDEDLFNSAHTFRDLMFYGALSSQQFKHTFHRLSSVSPQIRPSLSPENDEETIKRVEYVTKFYLNVVSARVLKQSILLDSGRFDDVMTTLDAATAKRPSTPRYIPYKDDLVPTESVVFVLNSPTVPTTPVVLSTTQNTIAKHVRKESKGPKDPKRRPSMDRIVVHSVSPRTADVIKDGEVPK